MKLKKARITNYRSVEDSGVGLSELICLVGKNEAGKTAILQAVAGLNPHPSTPIVFDKETDYPRRFFTNYSKRHNGGEATVVTTHWEMSPEQRESIADYIGESAISNNLITVFRRYGDKEAQWVFPIDYGQAAKNLVSAEKLNASERDAIGTFDTSDELRDGLKKLSERTERQQRLLDRLTKLPGENVKGLLLSIFKTSMPSFMYFSHYDRMVGQIRVDDLYQPADWVTHGIPESAVA